MERENFGSRLGFIPVSAGCAIGIGNVWRFPYVAGQNGGAVFVFFYLLFLLCMGVPVLTMELAVGRASGLKRPGWMKHYFRVVLPVLILVILIRGSLPVFSAVAVTTIVTVTIIA